MTRRVLVVGATGFHGSAIVRALTRDSGTEPIGLSRTAPAAGAAGRWRFGDLTDSGSLGRASQDVDTIILAGGYVGYDPDICRAVNIDGTRNLVKAAKRNGVHNIVYVSTCGVYGRGPHRGTTVQSTQLRPATVLSSSRLEAEGIVLANGGTVLRPHLVFGNGDIRVMPALVRLNMLLGGLVDGGRSLVSAIHVDDLARIAVRTALSSERAQPVAHAALEQAVTIAALTRLACSAANVPYLSMSVDIVAAREAARGSKALTTAVEMSGVDDWFEASSTWDALGLDSPGYPSLCERDRSWYAAEPR